MLVLTRGQKFLVAITLSVFCAGASAQSTVYKWVDEDGVVHFGDAPPDEYTVAETLVIPKAPPAPTVTQSMADSADQPATTGKSETTQDEAEEPLLYVKTDTSKLSIAELNLRCDEAREEEIAPLREAEIAKCKQEKREDPAFCERFNADFGEGGRTVSGSVRPKMFADLPECVETTEELNRRKR